MPKIAVVRITEFEDGSTASMADSFAKAARDEGHEIIETTTVFSKSCHCGGHCRQHGGEGCGDDDCVCTFAKSVPGCDCVVLAFPVEYGFSPTALNRVIHKVTYDCEPSPDGLRKKVFVISPSEAFDDYAFNDALAVIKMECNVKNWEYAGELLVPGLPDSCTGADPKSRRMAAELAKKI